MSPSLLALKLIGLQSTLRRHSIEIVPNILRDKGHKLSDVTGVILDVLSSNLISAKQVVETHCYINLVCLADIS